MIDENHKTGSTNQKFLQRPGANNVKTCVSSFFIIICSFIHLVSGYTQHPKAYESRIPIVFENYRIYVCICVRAWLRLMCLCVYKREDEEITLRLLYIGSFISNKRQSQARFDSYV